MGNTERHLFFICYNKKNSETRIFCTFGINDFRHFGMNHIWKRDDDLYVLPQQQQTIESYTIYNTAQKSWHPTST